MKLRPATPAEIEQWDAQVLANPDGGQYMQARVWGEFKRGHHWAPQYYIGEGAEANLALLFLVRQMPGFGQLWYLPKGPGVTDTEQLLKVVQAVKVLNPPAFVVKFDPELLEDEVDARKLIKAGLIKTRGNVQFKATIRVNLSPCEDEILASFKQKTRYNIRLSEKKGVTVAPVPATPENLEKMYELVTTTQARAGYFIRSHDYMLEYWRAQAEAGQAQLFFASFEGEVLAGIYVTYFGAKAWYKDGGSFRIHQNVMAPYLLQWEAMRWLKTRGVTLYDLVGVPPRVALGTGHLLDSLYQFKAGFEPEITEFMGPYDLPLSSRYKWWARGGERLAVAWQSKIQHDFL